MGFFNPLAGAASVKRHFGPYQPFVADFAVILWNYVAGMCFCFALCNTLRDIFFFTDFKILKD